MDQPAKILVVDNQNRVRRATCHLLESAGYTPFEASTGVEALRLANEYKPALALVNVNLPDISGFDICKQFKTDARLHHLLVMLVSEQHTGGSSLSEELATEADGYITRPIPKRELLARVQAMLRIHSAEHALRQSEERFRTMTNFTQDWEYWIGPDGQFIHITPSCAAVCGYPAREFREDPDMLNKIVHPVDLVEFKAHEQSTFQSELPASLEMRIITRSGEVRWIQHNCRPVYDMHGRWQGRRASNRDITERKQAEEILERQNRTLRLVQEIAQEINGELDLAVVLHNIMQHAVDLGRADRGGGIYLYEAGPNFLRLVEGAGINRERIGITVGINEGVAGRVFRTAQPLLIDDYNRWPERTNVLVAKPSSTVMGIPLQIKGRVIGALTLIANSMQRTFTEEDTRLAGMFAAQASIAIQNAQLYKKAQDEIVERKLVEKIFKESEDRFRSIIANTAAGYFFIDQKGLWRQVNHAWLQMHGYDSADEVIGQSYVLTQVDLDLHQAENNVKALLSGGPIPTGEFSRRCKDGSIGYHYFSAIPVIKGGEIVGLEGFIIDTTARKRAEEELEKSYAELRSLAFRLAQVAESQRRSLALDLNNHLGQNLAVLQNNINDINNLLSPETAENAAPQLVDSSHRIEEMIRQVDDLIAVLRPPLLEEFGLLAALRQYAAQYHRRTALNMELLESGQPFPRLSLDIETILFRVTQEALNNVASHARANQVILRLEAIEKTIRIIVTDDGQGFDPSQAVAQGKPSGWGLVSMRARVEAIGGSLKITSHPGKGTKIIVEIPYLSPGGMIELK